MNKFYSLLEKYDPIDEGIGQTMAKVGLGLGLAFNPIETGNQTRGPIPKNTQEQPSQTVKVPKVSLHQFIKYMSRFIESNEARRNKVYKDHLGNPTVGVGFNLNRSGAADTLSKVGLDYNRVLKGQILKNHQIDLLLKQDVADATKSAMRFVNNYESLPNPAKIVLTDMSFNLGASKLNKFKKFKAALEREDFKTAAKEMIASDWYGQVGDRSKMLVRIMKQL